MSSVKKKFMRLKRIANELRDFEKNTTYDIYLEEENEIDTVRVVIPGPKDSLYEGGSYVIRIHFPPEYPYKSPSVAFLNKIYHPNVDWDSGSVCLNALNHDWKECYTIYQMVTNLLPFLLHTPNGSDPLNQDAGLLCERCPEKYKKQVIEAVQKNAQPQHFQHLLTKYNWRFKDRNKSKKKEAMLMDDDDDIDDDDLLDTSDEDEDEDEDIEDNSHTHATNSQIRDEERENHSNAREKSTTASSDSVMKEIQIPKSRVEDEKQRPQRSSSMTPLISYSTVSTPRTLVSDSSPLATSADVLMTNALTDSPMRATPPLPLLDEDVFNCWWRQYASSASMSSFDLYPTSHNRSHSHTKQSSSNPRPQSFHTSFIKTKRRKNRYTEQESPPPIPRVKRATSWAESRYSRNSPFHTPQPSASAPRLMKRARSHTCHSYYNDDDEDLSSMDEEPLSSAQDIMHSASTFTLPDANNSKQGMSPFLTPVHGSVRIGSRTAMSLTPQPPLPQSRYFLSHSASSSHKRRGVKHKLVSSQTCPQSPPTKKYKTNDGNTSYIFRPPILSPTRFDIDSTKDSMDLDDSN